MLTSADSGYLIDGRISMNQGNRRERSRAGTRTMEPPRRGSETVVAEPAWVRLLVWLGFPLLGGGAVWLLKAVTGWMVFFPWKPFKLAGELISSVGEPWATVGTVTVGALAGLALALIAADERLTVSVSDSRASVTRGGSSQEIEHASVRAVFLDGKQLVVLGHETEELAREASDLDADRLRAAFIAHGYPWLSGGDPFEDEYRLWVEDMPDLPSGADALLKARARALGKDDAGKKDAAELRTELARLGIVVREEDKRQYWRRTAQPTKATGGAAGA